MSIPDFTTVTEVTGYKVSRDQIKRMYTRYRFAAGYCHGKDVLEVACGSGQGLGYLALKARKVVGGDIDEKNLKFARDYYQGRPNIELRILDAHKLPFSDSSFDCVILYEAIYYLDDPELFVAEARRVLRDNGVIIICTANKDLADFNPSPYSKRYFGANELASLLKSSGWRNIGIFGDSPVNSNSLKSKVISLVKKTAVALHLVPKTMKGKEFLKRIVFGSLQPLPSEIMDGQSVYQEPSVLPADLPDRKHKVLFAVGYK